MFTEVKTDSKSMNGEELLKGVRQRFAIFGGMGHSVDDAQEVSAHFDFPAADLPKLVQALKEDLDADFSVRVIYWR